MRSLGSCICVLCRSCHEVHRADRAFRKGVKKLAICGDQGYCQFLGQCDVHTIIHRARENGDQRQHPLCEGLVRSTEVVP